MVEKTYYKHYKGNIYLVISVAKHTENSEDLVIYKEVSSKENKTWARPLSMFNDFIEKDGKTIKRFSKISLSDFLKETVFEDE